MITALALLGYAACAAWCAPALLAPLTRRGASVRAGLAAWLAAMAGVLVSAAVAVQASLAAVAADWPQLTQALCRSVAGDACTPAVYRSALYEGGVTTLAGALALLSAAALWRYGRRVRRSRAQTRSHARTALLVGRSIAGLADGVQHSEFTVAGGPVSSAAGERASGAAGGSAGRRPRPAVGAAGTRAVMLDDPRPAAYCVAGRPAAIVVTSGALTVLDPPQLRAVLAHESAHLAHGHHALATVTRGLAAALPVPLFTRGAAEVARLAEMSADDTAARTSGRPALAAALIAIATGTRYPSAGIAGAGRPGAGVPRGALAATACAVPDRVERLLRPASRASAAACAAALTVALAVLAAAPLALTLLAAR